MAKPRKAKGSAVDTREADLWLEGDRAIPRADLETPDTRRGRQRFYRIYIMIAAALFPFAILGYVTLLPGWFSAQDAALMATSSQETSPAAKQAAMKEVQEWLDSDPAPLPGGHIISWDGVTSSEPATENTDGDQVTVIPGYEVHTFTLGTGGTANFTSRVQVSVDDALGVLVQGNPSLEPILPTALAAADPWPGVSAEAPPEPVMQAANSWADAYTSGDSAKLGLLTGDPDTAHSYLPLTGASGATDAASGTAAIREDGYMVVRTSFTPLWNVPAPAPTTPDAVPADPAEATPVTYDLLVDKADTASPVVVAWGGPGGLDDLTPYGNAMVGIDLEESGVDAGGLTNPDDLVANDQTSDTDDSSTTESEGN
ncbi:hypothetical protein LG293_16345 (plasmid) [Citricoccus nitrophenolicus]